jgi:hypothetical protein
MDLAYIDDSGNTDPGGSATFTLGCVVVSADAWPVVFDELIEYRRFLRTSFGIPVRAEIKANYLLRNGGPLRPLGLSESARYAIYRGHLRMHPKLGLRSFAVVVQKHSLWAREPSGDPRERAWEYLLQRLERMSTLSRTPVMVVHDEGNGALIRKYCRKARRAGGAGSRLGSGHLSRPARLLIDDPVERRSNENYLVQMADLVAYAAFRNVVPPPPRPVHIVPQNMWSELGSAAFGEVNKYSGGTPGIVIAA